MNICNSTTIFRKVKNKENPYVQINRHSIQDIRLSWKAKGLLAYCLSMQDDWIFYKSELMKHSPDGETSLRSAINELKKFGYMKTVQERFEDGRFARQITNIYEVPEDPSNDSPLGQTDISPEVDFQLVDNSISVNRPLIKNNSNKEQYINKNNNNIVEFGERSNFIKEDNTFKFDMPNTQEPYLINLPVLSNKNSDTKDLYVVNNKVNEPMDIEVSERETCIFPLTNKMKVASRVSEVFEYWKSKFNHPRAQLDYKRRSTIERALKQYGPEDIKKAIDGCKKTPHNMGDNERGEMYYGLHVILKDSDQIERFMRNDDNPPQKRKLAPTTATERASVALKETVKYFQGRQDYFQKEFDNGISTGQIARIENMSFEGLE